jgi:hypothetical protein
MPGCLLAAAQVAVAFSATRRSWSGLVLRCTRAQLNACRPDHDRQGGEVGVPEAAYGRRRTFVVSERDVHQGTLRAQRLPNTRPPSGGPCRATWPIGSGRSRSQACFRRPSSDSRRHGWRDARRPAAMRGALASARGRCSLRRREHLDDCCLRECATLASALDAMTLLLCSTRELWRRSSCSSTKEVVTRVLIAARTDPDWISTSSGRVGWRSQRGRS